MRARDDPRLDRRARLGRVAAWAHCDDMIRAVVTGSVARGERADDALSDPDHEHAVAAPSALEADTGSQCCSEILVDEVVERPGWHPPRLVCAAGTIDVLVTAGILPGGVSHERSVRVPIDKDTIEGTFRRSPRDQHPPSTVVALRRCGPWCAVASRGATCLNAYRKEVRYEIREPGWPAGWLRAAIPPWKHVAQDERWAARRRAGDNGTHLWIWMETDLLRGAEACCSTPSLQQATRALWEFRCLFDGADNVPYSVSRSTDSSTEHRIEEGILLAPAKPIC